MLGSLFNPRERVDVEVIIGTRNEGQQLAFTIHSLIYALERTPHTWRIIVVDNDSRDYSTKYFLEDRNGVSAPRGLVSHGFVQIYSYPWISNVGARDWAVRNVCTAKYIFFADAHIVVDAESFNYMIETLETHKPSIVHAPLDYLGGQRTPHGVQYSLKFGEAKSLYGTWNPYQVVTDKPFWIPALGHAFFGMKRDEYFKIGGYDPYHREYGGLEVPFAMACWMLGNGVMVDMRAHFVHSAFGRGYNYNSLNLDHNYFLSAYLIGGEKYALCSLMYFYQVKPLLKKVWKNLYDEAIQEAQVHRQFIVSNQHTSMEEILGVGKEPNCDGKEYKMQAHFMYPWDVRNEELYKKHISFVRQFDLRKEEDKVYIGEQEITDVNALELYHAILKL